MSNLFIKAIEAERERVKGQSTAHKIVCQKPGDCLTCFSIIEQLDSMIRIVDDIELRLEATPPQKLQLDGETMPGTYWLIKMEEE